MSSPYRPVPAFDSSAEGPAAEAGVPRPPGPNDPEPVGADQPPIIAWHEFRAGDEPPARHQRYRRVAARTLSKAGGDSLFGLSSQAAFWCARSTAPMLLALLGLTRVIAPLFGPATLTDVHTGIVHFLHGVFNPEVANNLVGDTVNTILDAPRDDVVSVGLIVSLWAGSSAISALIEAIRGPRRIRTAIGVSDDLAAELSRCQPRRRGGWSSSVTSATAWVPGLM
jgi:hypothetical protein